LNEFLISLQSIGEESSGEKVQNDFAAKKQCLIEQYSGFQDPQTSLHLNGERTVIENFADNAGIGMAYRAYRKWNEKFNGKRQNLIGLDFTWDQLFWISMAQTWCGVYRDGRKLFNPI
jgi:predicted metalloendopeptidase